MSYSRLIAAGGVILVAGIGVAPAFGQQPEQPAPAKPPVVQHELEARDQCLMCHTPGAMEPVPDAPASHKARPNESCLLCHASDALVQTTDPPTVKHDLEGRDQCLMCHTPGAMKPVPDAPVSHQGWVNEFCALCHKPAPSHPK